MQHPFSSLPSPKPDPLFAIAAEANRAGPTAINGTIGVYMDEDGKVAVFPSVARAVADIAVRLPSETFGYPPLLGLPEFRTSVERLLFSGRREHIASIATTAGTGALAVNLRLLKMLTESGDIILPVPAWANHPPPALDAGFAVKEVPYIVDGKPSVEPMLTMLKKRKDKQSFGVLLQVSCHNPTGIDFTSEEWLSLATFLAAQPCTVLLDFAYQGFKHEPEEDAKALSVFIDAGVPTLVSWSAAKNHSIYSARAGLACAVVPDEATKNVVEGTYSMITRRLHSAAPTFGQSIVARVQQHYAKEWLADLRMARGVMKQKRDLLLEKLPPSFHASLRGYGMFAVLPLTEKQIIRLKTEHNTFLTLDGRINIAGIPLKRIAELGGKIAQVL
jgi:aspartate/tyrosine/aromatic aminotransferase